MACSLSVTPKYSGWIAGMVIGKSIYKVEFCRELKVFFFALRSPLLYPSLPELVRFSCLNNYGNWECSLVTLLSSMTVFKDSIHIGSISPSSTIHLGLSLLIEARSRMMVENKPAKKKRTITNQPPLSPSTHTFFLLQGTQDEALKTSVWEAACITISLQIQGKILRL